MRRELEKEIGWAVAEALGWSQPRLHLNGPHVADVVLRHLESLGYVICKVEGQAPTTEITLPVLHIKNLE